MAGGRRGRTGLLRACGWALGAMGFAAGIFEHCSVGPVCLSKACVCVCVRACVNLALSPRLF